MKKNTTISQITVLFINWSCNCIYVLKIPFGNCGSVKQVFKEKIDITQQEASRLSKLESTYDAKTMIIKMKFKPILMFLSKVYCFPYSLSAKLNSIIMKYFLGRDNSVTMTEISENRSEGGHGVPDIPFYMQLLFVNEIKQCIQIKT